MKKLILAILLSLALLFAAGMPTYAVPEVAFEQDDLVYADGDINYTDWNEDPVQRTEHIMDYADILTDAQTLTLEQAAADCSVRYDCGVYIAAIDDWRDYSTYSVMDAAAEILETNGWGHGENKDAVLLMLSMDDRDYALVAHSWGSDAITAKGRGLIEDAMLPYFGDDDWVGGFTEYIGKTGELLASARAGNTVDYTPEELEEIARQERQEEIAGSMFIIIFVPLVVAYIVLAIAKRGMRSVSKASSAQGYVLPDSFKLINSKDRYTRTQRSSRKIVTSSGSSGHGSGFSSSRGGGYSGSSGKF